MSPPPANAATSQFSALAAAVAGERFGQSMGVGARTIEDLVKEVMRPMIKEWLDDNLPALVERLVGREIDRMSRRAEDSIDD
jgi:cell pole-organizing protein PopZ